MKNLYEPEVLQEMLGRIRKITPDTQPEWGVMNAAQMLEHCARALDFATGRTKPPRALIGRILGPLFKSLYYSDKRFDKNSPTADTFKVTDQPDFNQTKTRLEHLVKEFSTGGPLAATTHPSPFFGKLTAAQHGLGQYKHLDHHLTQFGV